MGDRGVAVHRMDSLENVDCFVMVDEGHEGGGEAQTLLCSCLFPS